MATLQTALGIPALRSTCLYSWEALVRAVSLDNLGPILNQVVVVLLKSDVKYTEEDIARLKIIIDYMIVENEMSLSSYFSAVPSLSEYAYLARASQVIQKYHKDMSLEKNLEICLYSGIRHDNAMVTHQSLLKLRRLLEENEDHIYSYFKAEELNHLAVPLIQVLFETIKRYNGSRSDIQVLCCECIGIIGAIDPARVLTSKPIESNSEALLDNFQNEEDTIQFVCSFIEKRLTPVFRSTQSTITQGHLSFAIQELLKECGFTAEVVLGAHTSAYANAQERIRKRWVEFPKSVKDVLRPLLTSKYYSSTPNITPAQYPIYPRKVSHTLWLQSWTGDLINKSRAGKHSKIFTVCRNLKDDHSISSHLLPHLVLNVLQNGSKEERKDILDEFMSVLGHDSTPVDLGGNNGGVSADCAALTSTNYDSTEKRQLCAQTIFSLFDHLTQWRRNLKRRHLQETALFKRTKIPNTNLVLYENAISNVSELLECIPQLVLAEASFKCESYARSLMHFELHFREERDKPDSTTNIQPLYGRLQEIYSKLDEVDGLEGITTKLLCPTLDQQILEHESTGMWTAAQTCNELALQNHPGELKYHIGLLNCFKNLNNIGKRGLV